MDFKFLSAAAVVAAAFASMAQAQGRPPAELPPAGFAGQQYVDSRGCVFIRAGHGGQVNWVSRIDRARKPICGQPPSLAVMAEAKRELAAPAPAAVQTAAAAPARATAPAARGRAPAPSQYVPPPVTYGKPQPLVGYAAPARTAPAAAAPPQQLAEVLGYGHWPRVPGWPSDNGNRINPQGVPAQGGVLTPNTGGHPPLRHRSTGCPEDAPHGRIYDLADGRNIMLCATKPHTLRNISQQQLNRYHGYGQQAGGAAVVLQPAVQQASADLMAPPAGYKQAWRDDRLNPRRGEQSAAGRQQMNRVWTEEVPAELRAGVDAAGNRVAVSTRGQIVPPAAVGGARFVQVGSFAQPGNAARAAQRLQAMGLPVEVQRGAIRGKAVQIVRAGPFGSDAQAGQALAAARQNGFADAILRR